MSTDPGDQGANDNGATPVGTVEELQEHLGVDFPLSSRTILDRARTHSSFSSDNYERLEFLGDAILRAVIAEHLWTTQPEADPGKLTVQIAWLVADRNLARIARRLDLRRFIKMGKGTINLGGLDNPSILAEVVEALIGAVYVTLGFEAAHIFIHDKLFGRVDFQPGVDGYKDLKSVLQECCEAHYGKRPVYMVEAVIGPDHEPEFTVQVSIDDDVMGRGRGRTKQNAERQAAKAALDRESGTCWPGNQGKRSRG